MTDNGITWTNEKRRLSQLIPWEHNPRQTRKDQAERMVDSLASFGQVQTIAIGPFDEIYDGHQRKFVWSAAREFGPDFEVDVRMSNRPLTEKERQQLVVYLHKGAAGEWDFDLLANGFDVGDLLEWGFDEVELGLAGFDLGDEPIADPEPQIDKAAELQEKWQVQRGQVWQVGRHRVMCGDSTVVGDVERLMSGEGADAAITDLPYNIGKDYGTWDDSLPSLVFWDNMVPSWLKTIKRSLTEPAHFLTTFSERGANRLINLAEMHGFVHRHTGVWHNPNRLAGSWPGQWSYGWEPILDFTLGKWRKLNNGNGVGFSDVWIIESPIKAISKQPYHPTEKPLELYVDLVDLVTDHGQVVLEPCAGLGTTLVACEQIGRIGYGMEIEPKYCAVTLERLAGMGLEPKLLT